MSEFKFGIMCLTMLMGVACAHRDVLIAEATQRPWRPSIRVETSLVPDASEVRLTTADPDMNLVLHQTENGMWMVELSEGQLTELLKDQSERLVSAEISYLHRTSKISPARDVKRLEILVRREAP